MSDHFEGWPLGGRMHAHTGTCIKCGSPEGDTTIDVRLISTCGRRALSLEGVGSQLCPKCKAKYLPLTLAMDREFDRLADKLWRDLKKRGCPCCQSGLAWYPVEQVH
jgi:hypothetical protein